MDGNRTIQSRVRNDPVEQLRLELELQKIEPVLYRPATDQTHTKRVNIILLFYILVDSSSKILFGGL